jgi:uncharacterized SAM-binding protein YcdF (DUF218 family)
MNFLFLSKLLPIFIYPLGLSCVLLIWAFFLALRRSRLAAIPIVLSLAILAIASNPRISDALFKSLEWQNLPPQELPTADAIVVLGGATRSISPPRVMPDLNEHGDRIIYAAKLYKDGKAPLIILSGGRIQWYGKEESEAKDMARLLELTGVPQEAIIRENKSLNTYENAIFTKKILEAKGLKKILLVTSAFHTPRSLKIFARQGIEAIPAPTDFLISEQKILQHDYSLEARIFSYLPDAESLYYTNKAIKEYIGTLIYRLRGWL